MVSILINRYDQPLWVLSTFTKSDRAKATLRRSDFECASIRWPVVCRANAVGNVIAYAKDRSRLHQAVIRVYDEAGSVIETHEHAGDFKEF